jgi:hypothetical protein
MNMRTIGGWCLPAFVAAAAFAAEPDDAVLLKSLFRYRMAETVVAQAEQLAPAADSEAAEQIAGAVQNWKLEMLRAIRTDVDRQFGPRAREAFQQFTTDFSKAEESSDRSFLQALTAAAELNPPPADYNELARRMWDSVLSSEMQKAADFLSEIETWLAVRAKGVQTPPLNYWLTRNRAEVAAAAPAAGAPPPPGSKPASRC